MARLGVEIGFLAVCVIACQAAQPVKLIAWPQKFSTFYALDAPAVPARLRVAGVSAVATDGAIWRTDGVGLRRDGKEYFSGKRYLPDDDVLNLLPDQAAGIWARTRTGVSHIELRPMTLAAKAAIFEERIQLRHFRHGLVAPSNLRVAGDLSSNEMRDDDNDGLWTSMYAAAECFRYAVTKSPEALAKAQKATEAVLFLEQVAGKTGFPARSFIRKGEPVPTDGEWHWTADGEYYWKGDTSSDEIVGHLFLYAIASDLLPDAVLRKEIAATTARIMDHILAHGYNLVGPPGHPTRWGRWSPQYFQEAKEDSPLNSVELLSFLKCAAHITGEQRYEMEYKKVALELGYAQTATRYLELRDDINYSDEELAMLAFYGLFRYEQDQNLKERFYRKALNAWWENEQREENPLWTLIYATALPQARVGIASAAYTLYRMPMDLIDWSVKNSQRTDVVMDSSTDRFQRAQAKTLLPRDELPVMKWNSNPFEVDHVADGRSEDDGAAFLLPYWMGRYHGLLLGN
jgi:hypothetical protein